MQETLAVSAMTGAVVSSLTTAPVTALRVKVMSGASIPFSFTDLLDAACSESEEIPR